MRRMVGVLVAAGITAGLALAAIQGLQQDPGKAHLLSQLQAADPRERQIADQALIAAALVALEAAPGDGRGAPLTDPPGEADELVDYRTAAGDVIPGGGTEIVVALTRLPEEGFLVVFSWTDGAWRPVARVSGLSRVTSVDVRSLVGRPVAEIVLLDVHDEMLGAFFRQERMLILRWDGGEGLRPVWDQVVWAEQYSLDPPMAERRLVEATVELEGRQIRTDTVITDARRDAAGDYQETGRRTQERRYRWDGARFVQEP